MKKPELYISWPPPSYKNELHSLVESKLSNIEEILRYSTERYYDTKTDRLVVAGKDGSVLVIIPHDIDEENTITPITIHATSRQQISYRVRSGRFENE